MKYSAKVEKEFNACIEYVGNVNTIADDLSNLYVSTWKPIAPDAEPSKVLKSISDFMSNEQSDQKFFYARDNKTGKFWLFAGDSEDDIISSLKSCKEIKDDKKSANKIAGIL